jgi:hypothetical protein
MPEEREPPRKANFLFRVVSDNWGQDGEYWVPVDMSKLGPGFPFMKGMTYAACLEASNGGMSNPLPELALPATPPWWPATAPPWAGYVLVDMKQASEFMQYLVFGANIQASKTLQPSVTYETEDDWLWPAVLRGKGRLPLQIYNITGSNLVSVVPNVYLQPETRARVKVIVRQWWTTNDWSGVLKRPLDVYAAAREIRIGYPGDNRVIRCLHEKVETPSYNTGNIKTIEYPATKPTSWISDLVNKINKVNGRYFREEREYRVPFDPLDKHTVPRAVGS